jgi:hypothetical protein
MSERLTGRVTVIHWYENTPVPECGHIQTLKGGKFFFRLGEVEAGRMPIPGAVIEFEQSPTDRVGGNPVARRIEIISEPAPASSRHS